VLNLLHSSRFLGAAPPIPRSVHRLGSTVQSRDPGARPLSDGAARWSNRWSSQLLHILFRSGGVPEPEGPASLEGSANGGPGVVREGVGDVGGVVVVHGANV
jgi:hypothetical protein